MKNINSQSFWRGIYGNAVGTLRAESPEKIIERAWGKDETTRLITRAVSASATTSTTNWGRDVVPIALGNFLTTLAPASAASKLYAESVQLNFDTVNQIIVPKVVTAPTGTWISEGSPGAMVQPVYGQVLVGPPKKLLFGAACTIDLQTYSAESATSILQRTVIDAATVALDSALLDNAAADATRPAGLLAGLSTLGATAGGGIAALVGDLGKIAGAMSTAKISAEGLMLFMNDAAAIRARGLLSPVFGSAYTIVGTPALAATTIIGVAPGALAMYVGPPSVEVRNDGLVHMDSTSPRNIDTQAVSETVKAAWQAQLFLIKVRLLTTWAPLQTGAVQMITSISW